MPRLRDGLLPALVLSLLLLQYAAVQHVLSHMGLAEHGLWAGAPLVDDGDADDDPSAGACEAPQLHAVIDGVPLQGAPVTPLEDRPRAAPRLVLVAVAGLSPPQPHVRDPPLTSL